MSGMSLLQGLSFNVLYLSEAADLSHPFLLSAHQIHVFISHPGLLGRIICPFSMTEAQSTVLKIGGSHFFLKSAETKLLLTVLFLIPHFSNPGDGEKHHGEPRQPDCPDAVDIVTWQQ